MKPFKNHILLFLLLTWSQSGFAQQIKFRDVLGNTGYDYGMSAQQTFDNGYIVCGSTTSVGSGNTDVYIIKTDSLGKPVNERFFGGMYVDQGTCIKQTADSGYVILGYTNDLGAGGYDIYVLKIDAKLNPLWKKTYGGADWDFGNSIKQTTDGGYIILGSTYSYGNGDEDYYLIKTDAKGDTLWTKTYGGKEREEGKSVIQTSDGGYAFTGYSLSLGDSLGQFYTVKTNATGDVTWVNQFGGPELDKANDIIELHAGGFIVCGETQSFGAGKSDGILVELSTNGISGRTTMIGDKEDDNLISVVERVDGRIMYAGITNSYGYKTGKGDIYFGMMNKDWTFNMSTTFGSLSKETVNSMAATSDKGAIICGSTNGFRNLLEDIYLIKTDSSGISAPLETVILTSVDELQKNAIQNVSVFPNPAQGIAYLEITTTSGHPLTLQLMDVTGRMLKQEIISSIPTNGTVPLTVSELASGIYFIKITSGESTFSKRIVVSH